MGMLFRYHNNNIDIKADKGATKPVVAPEPKEEKIENPVINDIKNRSGAKLRKLAKENGVVDPEELTIGELKAILIEKLS